MRLIFRIEPDFQSDNNIKFNPTPWCHPKTFPDHPLDFVSLYSLWNQALTHYQAKAGKTQIIGLQIDCKPLI